MNQTPSVHWVVGSPASVRTKTQGLQGSACTKPSFKRRLHYLTGKAAPRLAVLLLGKRLVPCLCLLQGEPEQGGKEQF